MVNQEIFKGLKQAISRGEALRSAMMSFYNAGYPKEDIEIAARLVQAERANQTQSQYSQVHEAEQKLKALGQQIQQSTIQKVSGYEEKKPKNAKRIIAIIVLSIILIALIGTLVSMFLYKEKVVELFTKWFG